MLIMKLLKDELK